MNEEKVEPFLRIIFRFPQCDSSILHLIMKSLIPNIPNSIQRQFSRSFLQQDGFDSDTTFLNRFGVRRGISR